VVREIVDGLMYVLGTGCQWASMPKDLPPRSTVNGWFCRWNHDGTLDRIHHAHYVRCREMAADPYRLSSRRDHDAEMGLHRLRRARPAPADRKNQKIVHFGAPAVEYLHNAQHMDGNPWVIAGTLTGRPHSDLQPYWQRVRARAWVRDVRIHDLRHTFASTAVASGQGLPMISKLRDHTRVQPTARYAQLVADPVRSAADALTILLRESFDTRLVHGRAQYRKPFERLSILQLQAQVGTGIFTALTFALVR
jgi:hypothetical protein